MAEAGAPAAVLDIVTVCAKGRYMMIGGGAVKLRQLEGVSKPLHLTVSICETREGNFADNEPIQGSGHRTASCVTPQLVVRVEGSWSRYGDRNI